MKKIAIIGAGNMGGAIARGLIARGACAAEEIVCTARSGKTRERLAAELPGVRVCADNCEAAACAETVILAVKPWLAEAVLSEMRGALIGAGTRILISVAAGVSAARLREALGAGTDAEAPEIFVAIPNTAAAVGQSMTFIAAGTGEPSEESKRRVIEIFSALGRAELVSEKQLAAGTAVASCGIAFAMRYARASAEGGVELGLPPKLALDAALQTLKGAAELLAASGEHPESEIDKVTTPGGITIRGLNRMEECGFSAAVIQGLRACR